MKEEIDKGQAESEYQSEIVGENVRYTILSFLSKKIKSSSLAGGLDRQPEKCYRYNDSMGLDFVNRHVAKILLAVEDGDSIILIDRDIDTLPVDQLYRVLTRLLNESR